MKNIILAFALVLFCAAPVAAQNYVTVTDVVVDRTAKNAVDARAQALTEGPRLAFIKLAEQSLTPESFKAFQIPSEATISALVHDFEIVEEQIGTDRYVGTFTYRFDPRINALLGVGTPPDSYASSTSDQQATLVWNGMPTAPATAEPALPVARKGTILILPFYHGMDGRARLWSDPNPWLSAWQKATLPEGGASYVVPLGDISDIGAGPEENTFSGDTRAARKLAGNYRADETFLTVANHSGTVLKIDIYSFANAEPKLMTTLNVHAGSENSELAYRQAVADVMGYLNSARLSREPSAAVSPRGLLMPPAQGSSEIEGMLAFGDISEWLDLQRRLNTLTPRPKMEILSLSRSIARFILRYEGAPAALEAALANAGITLSTPAVVVDETALHGGPSRPVYEMQLMQRAIQ